MGANRTADIIIIGGGVYGCGTAYNLAKHGARNVVLLERKAICSGGTGKSCAASRTHYSIETNLIHAVESLKIFENFAEMVGGDAGFRRTGYLILGPEEYGAPMQAVFRRQNENGIDTTTVSHEEAARIHPLLYLGDVEVIGYDTRGGYCDPHLTTTSYARRAQELGVTIETNTPVTGIHLNGRIKTVRTPSGDFECSTVVLAAGPWTHALGKMTGVEFPYVVSRHKVITLKGDQPYRIDWPIVKDLTTPDKIYLRSDSGGTVLIGTGDHGDPIEDPDSLTDQVDQAHIARIGALISRRMPEFFAKAKCTASWTGPYDITPDWNPLVGPVPGLEGIYVAVGFSGHGFKLAPTISEALAQSVLGLEPRLPLGEYSMTRFSQGGALHGAYGIGSIS